MCWFFEVILNWLYDNNLRLKFGEFLMFFGNFCLVLKEFYKIKLLDYMFSFMGLNVR